MNSVLVIEDDQDILENIEEILELQSYQALTTSSSLTGLQLAKEVLPSLGDLRCRDARIGWV